MEPFHGPELLWHQWELCALTVEGKDKRLSTCFDSYSQFLCYAKVIGGKKGVSSFSWFSSQRHACALPAGIVCICLLLFLPWDYLDSPSQSCDVAEVDAWGSLSFSRMVDRLPLRNGTEQSNLELDCFLLLLSSRNVAVRDWQLSLVVLLKIWLSLWLAV